LFPPTSFTFFVEYLFELYVSGFGLGDIVFNLIPPPPALIGLLLLLVRSIPPKEVSARGLANVVTLS